MNKTILKNFAIQSRRKLIEQVQTKTLLYGIDEKNGLHIEEQFGQLLINGQTYPLSMKPAFTALQKQVEQKGYKQLLEEAAYTWFNRIIAIRYMEVHEYLPERVNVLSSSVGRVDPDILFEYDTMDLNIKQEEVRELVNAGNTEAAFRILFVAQCNALNRILPFMFEPIQDYTELLLPDFLLDAESVIKTLVQNEELTESFAEIEVIGWLYQYYIAEEKDRVFAQKSKYKKEEIPFATQLFTPKWIVQYMVQNSLGRYWTEAHRKDEDLIDNWDYFIKHEEEDFHEKIAPYVNKELKVEDIKLLDPAMGSGHILVYAFEVFHEIYEKCGYPERDIPRLILENNLYGLDIDDRAYQLAAFAVVMKAVSYSKRFLRSVERDGIELNIASIQETNHVSEDVIAYIAQQEVGEQYNQVKAFFDQYYNAKTYGSLINITKREISFIEDRLNEIENNPALDLFNEKEHEIAKSVLPALVHQTKIMRNVYDVVVMNPPYMGSIGMDKILGDFLKKNYPDSKSDLFAAFMEVDFLLKKNGFYAAINQHSWMFLNSYEQLRNKIIDSKLIDSMVHLGAKAFEEIDGEVVQSTMFILRNTRLQGKKGIYIRLTEQKSSNEKKQYYLQCINNNLENKYLFDQNSFKEILDSPIVYWINKKQSDVFKVSRPLKDIAQPRAGLATGNNNIFQMFWYEIDFNKIGFGYTDVSETLDGKHKWFPCNSGGEHRKWSTNDRYVVNWENNGNDIKNYKNASGKIASRAQNTQYYFKKGVTWNKLSSSNFSAKFKSEGYIFDDTSRSAFIEDESKLLYTVGLLCSKVSLMYLEMLNPTMSYTNGDIERIPFIYSEKYSTKIKSIVNENILISKNDWDSSEISWDFKISPLIRNRSKNLAENFLEWQEYKEKQLKLLKSNEEELNQIYADIYNLNNIITNTVEVKDITLRKIDRESEAKAFISYVIGCIFGRYSIEKIEITNLNNNLDEKFKDEFKPISNGILSLNTSRYFELDIIEKLREVLLLIFPQNSVEENFNWLAESLGMKIGENVESRLRRYFTDEFFMDHCKMYQKCPIYWLVDSGKQKGLRTLIYMHRYELDTMATIRFEHLQEIQAKYQQEIADLENRLVNPNLSATDKKKLNAEKVSFEKKIEELREFDKRLAAIAAEEIEIDLDDGVKVNYEKFYRGGKGVLAKIK